MKITTVGIDLAKNILSVHGIDAHGKALTACALRNALVGLQRVLTEAL